MSKALRSFIGEEKLQVIMRRLTQKDKGLGYWAAVAAAKAMGIKLHKETE